MSESAATLRKEYEASKRQYHKAGKAAFGKSPKSKEKAAYKAAAGEYHRLGKKLGFATKRKPLSKKQKTRRK